VFNVADSCICIGAVMLVLESFKKSAPSVSPL
jgi:lipoprotein signal peptidase